MEIYISYEQFATWKWEDVYKWHVKPTTKAAMEFIDKNKTGYNLNVLYLPNYIWIKRILIFPHLYNMECPKCKINFYPQTKCQYLGENHGEASAIYWQTCLGCEELVIILKKSTNANDVLQNVILQTNHF